MKLTKNIGSVDKVIRIILAELFFILGFFWTYGTPQIILYVFALAMIVTALFSFCGLYTILGVNTCSVTKKSWSKNKQIAVVLFLVGAFVGGLYLSNFFTKKIFVEDYNKMNQYYKQTLFFTGQNKRVEATSNYNLLVSEYDVFYKKYSKYHPYVIASDTKFNADITTVKDLIISLRDSVVTGDLPSTHKEFEKVRPIFQDILKRNGFSLLTIYLVDFHDAMEKIITAADEGNASQIVADYQEVSDKLKAVEGVANDAEIQTIRQNLEQVITSARNGNVNVLKSQAGELKSSFVKVYLKRG